SALAEPAAYIADLADAPDILTAVVPEGYRLTHLDLAGYLDAHRGRPRRTTGHVYLADTPSFLAYWGKFANEASEVYATLNTGNASVTGVIDAPDKDLSAWGEHRVTFLPDVPPEWVRWLHADRQLLSQQAFAEHIEDSLPDIVEPNAATLLELVQSFEAATK